MFKALLRLPLSYVDLFSAKLYYLLSAGNTALGNEHTFIRRARFFWLFLLVPSILMLTYDLRTNFTKTLAASFQNSGLTNPFRTGAIAQEYLQAQNLLQGVQAVRAPSTTATEIAFTWFTAGAVVGLLAVLGLFAYTLYSKPSVTDVVKGLQEPVTINASGSIYHEPTIQTGIEKAVKDVHWEKPDTTKLSSGYENGAVLQLEEARVKVTPIPNGSDTEVFYKKADWMPASGEPDEPLVINGLTHRVVKSNPSQSVSESTGLPSSTFSTPESWVNSSKMEVADTLVTTAAANLVDKSRTFVMVPPKKLTELIGAAVEGTNLKAIPNEKVLEKLSTNIYEVVSQGVAKTVLATIADYLAECRTNYMIGAAVAAMSVTTLLFCGSYPAAVTSEVLPGTLAALVPSPVEVIHHCDALTSALTRAVCQALLPDWLLWLVPMTPEQVSLVNSFFDSLDALNDISTNVYATEINKLVDDPTGPTRFGFFIFTFFTNPAYQKWRNRLLWALIVLAALISLWILFDLELAELATAVEAAKIIRVAVAKAKAIKEKWEKVPPFTPPSDTPPSAEAPSSPGPGLFMDFIHWVRERWRNRRK